jgi:hypothetical protein
MEGFGSGESRLARNLDGPGKSNSFLGVPATARVGLSLSARFCVWLIIGTRKLSVTFRFVERNVESCGPWRFSTTDSVTTGSGRKHVPTLFETHSEKSAAEMIARIRG